MWNDCSYLPFMGYPWFAEFLGTSWNKQQVTIIGKQQGSGGRVRKGDAFPLQMFGPHFLIQEKWKLWPKIDDFHLKLEFLGVSLAQWERWKCFRLGGLHFGCWIGCWVAYFDIWRCLYRKIAGVSICVKDWNQAHVQDVPNHSRVFLFLKTIAPEDEMTSEFQGIGFLVSLHVCVILEFLTNDYSKPQRSTLD